LLKELVVIQELQINEIESVNGALTSGQVVTYILIGSVAVATGGSAAVVGGLLIAFTVAVA
jgi:hypothetical protein